MDQLLSQLPQAERELLTKFGDVRLNGLSDQLEQLQKQSLEMLLTQYKMVANLGDAIVTRLGKQRDQPLKQSQQTQLAEYERLATLRDAVVVGMGARIEQLQKQSLLMQRVEYELMAKLRDATVVAMEQQLQEHRQLDQLLRTQQIEFERLAKGEGGTSIRDEKNFAWMESPPSYSTNFTADPFATADPGMQAQLMHDQANLANLVAACRLDQDLRSAASGESKASDDFTRMTSPPSRSIDSTRNHLETDDLAVAQANLMLSQAATANALAVAARAWAVCETGQKLSAIALGPCKKWNKKKSKWVDVFDDSDSDS